MPLIYLKWFLMTFQILDIFWRLWFFHKRHPLKEKTKSSLAPATRPQILKIIKNHIKYVDDAWNYMFPENLSFLAWKMRIFKILLYDPWVQIKILHFLLSQTTEWFNQLTLKFKFGLLDLANSFQVQNDTRYQF